MSYKTMSYGKFEQAKVESDVDRHVENIKNRGFTVVQDVLNSSEIEQARERIEKVYEIQEAEFGRENLEKIQELDMARMLFVYDDFFLSFINRKKVTDIVSAMLKQKFILNLQNSIIIRSGKQHHQTSWHRDLPYQNYISSRPIAINALFCIDDFKKENGGTVVVPYTHQMEMIPSDKYIDENMVYAEAPAGSAIVFDSMLFHRGGYNDSGATRRAINHLYTAPIIKQQVDIPAMLNGKFSDNPEYAELLGYTMQVPLSVKDWRMSRLSKA